MWKPSVCTKDCPDTCGLLAKVEDGRIVKVKGDPEHPFTKGFICKKAGFFPHHVHGEERILTPLKRCGPKGSGQFEPISWDEALNQVVAEIKALLTDYGPESILPYFYAGHMGLIQRNAGQAFFTNWGPAGFWARFAAQPPLPDTRPLWGRDPARILNLQWIPI